MDGSAQFGLKGVMFFDPVELTERSFCRERIQPADRLLVRRRWRHQQFDYTRFLPAGSCGQCRFRDHHELAGGGLCAH